MADERDLLATHADLHKIEAHRVEREVSPAGMGFRLVEEEGAVGGGLSGDMILMGGGRMNGDSRESHDSGEQDQNTPVPVINLVGHDGTGQVLEMTQFGEDKMAVEEKSEQVSVEEHRGNDDNEQGHPHLDELCDKEENASAPAIKTSYNYNQHFPDSSKYLKTGLATPHMLRSTWDTEVEESQVKHQNTSTQLVTESPDRDSHFLEDFID